jgi:hypothetical protein
VQYVPGADRYYALVNPKGDDLFVFFTWNKQYLIVDSQTGRVLDKGIGDEPLKRYAELVPLKLTIHKPSRG